MKQIISLLSALIILIGVTPFSALAVEPAQSEYEELIDLACEVFPEYAADIRGENVSNYALSRSGEGEELMHIETRDVSDSEQLSLYQMRSGNTVVLYCGQEDLYDLTEQSSSTSNITTVGVTGTSTFKAASSVQSDIYILSNVSYVIYYNSNAYFSNYGTVTYNTFLGSSVSNSSTYIMHTLKVIDKPGAVIELRLYFQDDQLHVYLG